MSAKMDVVLDLSMTLLETLKKEGRAKFNKDRVYTYLENEVLQSEFKDFNTGLEWFNVTRPLSINSDMMGKITVLDFFTYCCINCLHIIPKLQELEETLSVKDGLIIIGVHSAKFSNEKDSENIKAALARYNISHPVVNDANGIMWDALGIPAWPTLLVLGPDASPLLIAVGEHYMTELELFLKAAVQYYEDKGKLSPHALPMLPNTYVPAIGPLKFPGKLAFCEALPGSELGYLAISDSGNHRILVCRDYGEVEFVVGGEEPGFIDGKFHLAKFSNPQGVTFHGRDIIFVADTGNDAIRKIDLMVGEVTTVVGREALGAAGAAGDTAAPPADKLSSPWDLVVVPDNSILLIAAAGNHQLWAYALENCELWRRFTLGALTCQAVAGTGREENRNNAYPHAAAFAQPSGICVAPELDAVFVADSESSSIRRVDLLSGQVMAVVGGDRSPTDLFCFGDVDGRMWDVRLQHPLGVAWNPAPESGLLYVADSFNHKIKIIDPEERTCTTLMGSGTAGDSLERGYEQFSEPGGICTNSTGDRLYVADTNNHCVKVIDLRKGLVRKLDVSIKEAEKKKNEAFKCLEAFVDVSVGGALVSCDMEFEIEENLTLIPDVPPRWILKLPGSFGWLADRVEGELTTQSPIKMVQPFTFLVPPGTLGQVSEVVMLAILMVCDKGSKICSKKCLSASITVKQLPRSAIKATLGPHAFKKPKDK